MRFWDTSAIVPLIVEEAPSKMCRDLFRADTNQIVSLLTRLEALSAIHRGRRQGFLDDEDVKRASGRLSVFSERWNQVPLADEVRRTAELLLKKHPLTAADSLQLAAALTWCSNRAKGRMFVVCDATLGAAATAEGFDVIEPK